MRRTQPLVIGLLGLLLGGLAVAALGGRGDRGSVYSLVDLRARLAAHPAGW